MSFDQSGPFFLWQFPFLDGSVNDQHEDEKNENNGSRWLVQRSRHCFASLVFTIALIFCMFRDRKLESKCKKEGDRQIMLDLPVTCPSFLNCVEKECILIILPLSSLEWDCGSRWVEKEGRSHNRLFRQDVGHCTEKGVREGETKRSAEQQLLTKRTEKYASGKGGHPAVADVKRYEGSSCFLGSDRAVARRSSNLSRADQK